MTGRAERILESDAAAPFQGFPEQGEIVIFDLEITAWEGSLARRWSGANEFMEVVQIGGVRLDAALPMQERGAFQLLVRPEKNPVLSTYFTDLTGITNGDLGREAVSFEQALDAFAAFSDGAALILSNGSDWADLVQNAEWAAMRWPFPPGLFSNIRPDIAAALGLSQSEIVSATLPRIVGLADMPAPHTGLGDARAIAAALREMRMAGRL